MLTLEDLQCDICNRYFCRWYQVYPILIFILLFITFLYFPRFRHKSCHLSLKYLWKNISFPTMWKPGVLSFCFYFVLVSYCCCNKLPWTNNKHLLSYTFSPLFVKIRKESGLHSFLEVLGGHLFLVFPASGGTHNSWLIALFLLAVRHFALLTCHPQSHLPRPVTSVGKGSVKES